MHLDLNRARLHHGSWRMQLRQYLEGNEPSDTTVPLSPQDCQFGKWLYTAGISKYANLADMSALELVHAQMHDAARRVVEHKKAGRHNEAREEYRKVAELGDKVIALLGQVEEKVSQIPVPGEEVLKPWPGLR
jgi:hypothetical protein